MTALWLKDELLTALGAKASDGAPAQVSGMSIDTRTLEKGDLFFALQGENRDGHDFVENAFKAGAAAAVVTAPNVARLKGFGPLLVVDDVLKGMERLGRASRARMTGRVVAVTGSVGKTSTKEALRHVLARQGATHASVASYNNHWGVPLTLARMPKATEFGVFEIGMNHPFEIIPLAGFVSPMSPSSRPLSLCIWSISAKFAASPTPRERSSADCCLAVRRSSTATIRISTA